MISFVLPSKQDWWDCLISEFSVEELDQIAAFLSGDRQALVTDYAPWVARAILSAPEELWTS